MRSAYNLARFLGFAFAACVSLGYAQLAHAQDDPAWRSVDPAKAAAAQSGRRATRTVAALPSPPASATRTGPASVAGNRNPNVPVVQNPKQNDLKTRASKGKGKKGKRQQAEAAEQLPPPRPPTPEQLPPTRPTVSYRNGQLSILANNSTMSDVLNSVRAQTGAQFEMNGVSSADRVYAKLGPGTPKDVLAALLDGSRFNFAILGSDTDPAAVARVVLMPKAGGASSMSASNPATPMQPLQRQVPQAQRDEQSDDEGQPEEAPAEEVQPEQPQPEQPQQQQPGQVKTPEQLLQELQQMQQQQQQQNPNGQPQPPQPQQQIPDREIPDDQPPQ